MVIPLRMVNFVLSKFHLSLKNEPNLRVTQASEGTAAAWQDLNRLRGPVFQDVPVLSTGGICCELQCKRPGILEEDQDQSPHGRCTGASWAEDSLDHLSREQVTRREAEASDPGIQASSGLPLSNCYISLET